MATGAAADGLYRSLYEGCISGCDTGKERRPYHRNCGCALHSKSSRDVRKIPNKTIVTATCRNVSYPMRRAWSESCLLLHCTAVSNHSSASSSPIASVPICRSQLIEEDDDIFSFNAKS